MSRGVEARLRIGVHGAVPLDGWTHLIKDLETRFPETVLEIQVGEGDAPIRRLTSDEAELAVVLSPSANRHGPGLMFRQLGKMEFVTVVDASKLTSDVPVDLTSLPQIRVADFDDAVTGFGIVEGHRYWRVADHRIKAALIAAGQGWGSVPTTLVEPALSNGTLAAIAYRGVGPRTEQPYFLCRKRERQHGPAADYIWQHGEERAAP